MAEVTKMASDTPPRKRTRILPAGRKSRSCTYSTAHTGAQDKILTILKKARGPWVPTNKLKLHSERYRILVGNLRKAGHKIETKAMFEGGVRSDFYRHT